LDLNIRPAAIVWQPLQFISSWRNLSWKIIHKYSKNLLISFMGSVKVKTIKIFGTKVRARIRISNSLRKITLIITQWFSLTNSITIYLANSTTLGMTLIHITRSFNTHLWSINQICINSNNCKIKIITKKIIFD